MLFSIRDVLHHLYSFRFHNPLLPGSATHAPRLYRTTVCRSFSGIHTQARPFGALDLDPACCVSISLFLPTFMCTELTYGGRRASLQLLERKATPACRSNIVSLNPLCAKYHSHLHMKAPDPFLGRISDANPPLSIRYRRHSIVRSRFAYSKEGDGNDDTPVLGARKLVDGVADVAFALGRAAGADTSGSFGKHVVVCYVCGMWLW